MSEEPTRNSEERSTIDVVLGNPTKRWQFVVGNVAAAALSLLGGVTVRGAIMWETAVLVGVDLSLAVSAEVVLNLFCPTCVYFGGWVF